MEIPNNANIASLKLATKTKKTLEGLNPDNNQKDRETYEAIRKRYIGHFEDQRFPEGTTYVYDDKTGKRLKKGKKSLGLRTVAIGFNMDRGGAEKEWDKAFSCLPQNQRPDFKKVKNTECELTKTQMMTLFNSCIKTREETLKKHFEGIWKKLLPNERMVIESVKYNTKVLDIKDKNHKWYQYNGHSTVIEGQTNFRKRLDKYVKAKEVGRFAQALDNLNESRWELKFKSNGNGISGIANRREAEEITLNTYDIPSSKERDKHFLANEIETLLSSRSNRNQSYALEEEKERKI